MIGQRSDGNQVGAGAGSHGRPSAASIDVAISHLRTQRLADDQLRPAELIAALDRAQRHQHDLALITERRMAR